MTQSNKKRFEALYCYSNIKGLPTGTKDKLISNIDLLEDIEKSARSSGNASVIIAKVLPIIIKKMGADYFPEELKKATSKILDINQAWGMSAASIFKHDLPEVLKSLDKKCLLEALEVIEKIAKIRENGHEGYNLKYTMVNRLPIVIEALGENCSPQSLKMVAEIAFAYDGLAPFLLRDGIPGLLKFGGYDALVALASEKRDVSRTSGDIVAKMMALVPANQRQLFFQKLMKGYGYPSAFREWLGDMDKAVNEMAKRCDWGDREKALWYEAVQRLNTWEEVGSLDSYTFPLIAQGIAYGVEIEKLNQERLEIRTPHTTDRKVVESYLKKAQQYFKANVASEPTMGLRPWYQVGLRPSTSCACPESSFP